jgi:peptide/nickel transport system substrate-binding protein
VSELHLKFRTTKGSGQVGARSWRSSTMAIAVATLLLAACGGSATPATNGATKAAAGTGTAAAATGSTAVVGLYEEPDTLNPIGGPLMFFAQDVQEVLFRNLFILNPDGSLSPDLATEVPSADNGGISADGLTYTFHLRSDAKWTDGNPVTSQDVYETYRLETNSAVKVASNAGWNDVDTFTVVSPTEFTIKLKKPFQPFLATVFTQTQPGIVPAAAFKGMSPEQVNSAGFNHNPTISDGPYKFVSWQPGASITVTANPDWYGPKPKIQTIVFKIIPNNNTLLTTAQAGGLNVYAGVPIQQLAEVQKIPGNHIFYTNSSLFEMIYTNQRNPALDDVRVRQALEMGIDRQAIVNTLLQGRATLLAADQSPASWGYDKDLQPWPFDPQKAAELLAQAGWTKGSDGILQKGGQKLSLVYSTTAGNTTRESTQRLVQNSLKQLGIDVQIHNYPANALFGTVLPSGQGWDLAEVAYNDQAANPASPQANFGTGGSFNWGKFSDPTLDKLYAEQSTMTSQAQRQPVIFQIERELHDQLPALWLYSPQGISATFHLSGYQPNPWMQDTWNVYDWALTK